MRKTYLFLLSLALCVLGSANASAERISLEEVPFWQHEEWGLAEPMTTPATPAWVIGESTGQPYGDSAVKDFADLSLYSKLIVVCTEGTPRFMFNRDVDEGQYNATEEESHLIEWPKSGWTDRYVSQEAGENEGEVIYTVDLKLIAKEKGYAHLHAIKGANWSNVTLLSMEVERQAKAPVGWTNLINNSSMEGEDNSSFFTRIYPDKTEPVPNSEILDGAGVDGTRGVMVEATDRGSYAWDNQFWFRLNEPVPAGSKYRVSFDYRADTEATVSTQSHAEPSDYIWYDMFGNLTFTEDWQTFTKEAEVTVSQGSDEQNTKTFQSVAFNLSELATANNYYFDNIKFEVFKLGTVAEFSNDVVQIDFGFDTNIPELVKACGKPRLMYPMDCAAVKVNGQKVELYSVEAFADGRFYIFLQNAVSEDDEVLVSFTNPTEEAFHMIYTSGIEGAVKDVDDLAATLNSEIEDNEGYPYDFVTPTLLVADPENGSFNLPNSIKEFYLTFDKNVDCASVVATFNDKPMAVTPADGFAEKLILTRDGEDDLPTGEYTIHVTKIYPQLRLADEIFGDTTYVVNIGKVEYDPDDMPAELIDASLFANCNAGGIPAGYIVNFNGEERIDPSTYGSGPRMFDFGAGGDFTKGLYFREGYVEYGSMEGYTLELTAGKKYYVRFNTAMWKDNGSKTRFRILDEFGEAVLTQIISNTPNVNGSTGAVSGSTYTEIKFIPENDGYYTLRWESAGDETSDPGYMEILLANVGMKYTPNQVGLEETLMLQTALENAKSTRDGNADERYAGEAFQALVDAIAKYEAEMGGYTAPSAYTKAAEELNALSQALKDHRQLCDNYDAQIKKAIDVVRQNRENKFAATTLYADVCDVVAKYHGTSEWVDVADHSAEEEGGDPVDPVWQLNYDFDKLTTDDVLTVAIDELAKVVNVASLLFTEGESAPENAHNGKATGVAVLVDRLRLGAESLKALGVDENNDLITAANNALFDDDELADKIKREITIIVYGNLKDANNTMFEPIVDDETLEETTPTYDVTVFAKNHNTYKLLPNMDFTPDNVPAWTTPEGFPKPGLTVGWGAPKHVEGVAEDCMFQTYKSPYRVEQTITDLPAGTYSIKYGFSERWDGEEGTMDGSFAYAKTSDTPEVEEGFEEDREYNFAGTADVVGAGQAFSFAVYGPGVQVDDIVVTDGVLTIGVNGGQTSGTFFNDIRILLTGPAPGFDYGTAYTEGIDSEMAAKVTVRSYEVYDLNGRRLAKAQRGIQIMKKHMSDGTTRIEKVVVK